MRYCEAHDLNPFAHEVYLVKYKSKNGPAKASIQLGIAGLTKRADQNPDFDGFESGVIVELNGEHKDIVGSLIPKVSTLIGGWAKVYRKGRRIPTTARVALAEYNQKRNVWNDKPATMIEKVAIMQALRRTFPDKPPPLDVEVTVDEPQIDPAAEWEPEVQDAIEGVETPPLVDMETGEVLDDPAAALGIGEPESVPEDEPEPAKPEGAFGTRPSPATA